MSIYDETVQLKHCVLELTIGEELGSGSFRRTYELLQEPGNVLKLQYSRGAHNSMEWEIWQAVRGTKWEKWFCPCVRIDSWGSALVMRRAVPFNSEREFLAKIKRVPSFFDDVKWGNWGMLDGRPVCIDYGHHHLFKLGFEAGAAMKRTAAHTNP